MIPYLKAGGRDLFRISELNLWINAGGSYDASAKIILSRQSRADDENINMSADEVAQYLYLDRGTIYTLKCFDKIPYIKMGQKLLFRSIEIDRWLDYGGTYEIALMIMGNRAVAV
jgi:excisionase family DNA binding protein